MALRALALFADSPRPRELPGLARPPYKNDLGKRIYEEISKEAWDEWIKHSVRYVNTYFGPGRLDISSKEGWRRPLLAWLGVQLKRAEAAGDSETAARLKRRIELVSG